MTAQTGSARPASPTSRVKIPSTRAATAYASRCRNHWPRWSSGTLRHYFGTRAELLAFACEEVVATVTRRIEHLRPQGSRLPALVDGLSVQVLAGHLPPGEAAAQLSAYLDDC